jgi:hypothetical protein
MLLLTGALVSGFLGYRLAGWWAPATVASVALALQAVAYQGVLSTADGLSGFIPMLALTGLTFLFVCYATFSMGRSLGLRRRRRRR